MSSNSKKVVDFPVKSKSKQKLTTVSGIYLEPGKPARQICFSPSGDELAKLVEGRFFSTLVINPKKRLIMLFNDEGRIYGCKPCRYIKERDVVIFGPIIICRYDTTMYRNLCSLTESQTGKLLERFSVPDEFIDYGDTITCLRMSK